MSVESNQNQVEQNADMNLEAVNRISKLPIVESTIETAAHIYTKVKDYNGVTNWTLATTENAVQKAVEIGKPYVAPVVSHLKEPIQKADGLLCTGLDYIEEKIPAVKLPPGEMYSGAKDYVTNTVGTRVESAKQMVEPAVETAKHMVEPAVEAAKHIVEPAVETAKHIIEPAVETAKQYIDPALETAQAIKDYGVQQVDKFLHPHAEDKDHLECEQCLNNHEEPKEVPVNN